MNELLANFHLMRPEWLLGIVLVLPAAWLGWRRLRSGRGWNSVIDASLLPHLLSGKGSHQSSRPLLLIVCAWLIALLALAGPSWKRLPQPVERKEDALVVVYDLSRSMYAEDISPSRLVRSRQKLLDLLRRKQEGTMGLVAYAGDAHVVSPLTDDLRTIENLLPALTPDIMPVAGSKPGLAVELAVNLLRDSGLEHGQILLLTDGISTSDTRQIKHELGSTRYRLSVLGVGTEAGGPIPTANGLLRDASGSIVIAGLEQAPLRKLANDHGGVYSDVQLSDADIDRVLQTDIWGELETEQVLGRSVDTWQDMGYWLLLLLVPIALASFRRGWLLCLLVLTLPEPAAADWQDLLLNRDQRGSKLLEAGDAATAATVFRDPDWAAAANYRAGEFDAAASHYQAGDDADSWYNQGNSLARGGKLEEAIAAYQQALQRQPDMEDAAFNKQLIEQLLQQQQQQQQQQQDGEQEQQNQEQQNQEQQQQDQGQQQQQDQGQSQQQDGEEQDSQQAGKDQEQQNQQQQQQGQAQPEDGEQDPDAAEQQAAQARDDEALERDMANEQWLRSIPDDPSGLLRRKFRYESQQRAAEQGNTEGRNETSW